MILFQKPKKLRISIKFQLTFYFFVFFLITCVEVRTQENQKIPKKLIILSIDGLPGYYLDSNSANWDILPNLKRLKDKGELFNRIESTYPTMTYPAHTSMITGVDPAVHGIYFNNPLDPFRKLSVDWYWFKEDILVPTLYDIAKKNGYKTANVYWPVTVGAEIDWNIPQFWKNKTVYDEKYLRAFSTKGLYAEVRNKIGNTIGESSSDEEKILAAIDIWEQKKPDLMLIYTTDLDTTHHEKGVNTLDAMNTLSKIDKLVGKLISKINLYKTENLGLIIVSDHGFKEVNGVCSPNKILIEKGLINVEKNLWSYVFKSLGGVSVLIRNENRETRAKVRSISLSELKTELESQCEDIEIDYNEEMFKKFKKKLFPKTLMAAYSKKNTVFSESLHATEVFKKVGTYWNHGFLPDDPAMHSIGFVYPKSLAKKEISNVKEFFTISCTWLGLVCK
ncbi:MAG: ectonucleotide pyrophosphatase/phosphodiesterase [Leptospiraceae bacterium]|nr:ectonucleotide pyrophosphatase/phosphodiesterase [Leptospiraceae bacterium]